MVKTEMELCKVCGAKITGWGRPHMQRNFEAHMEQQHNIKEKVEEAIAEEVVKKEVVVDLNKMTKDQINDYSAKLGFGEEIKASWKKSKMLSVLKSLIGK